MQGSWVAETWTYAHPYLSLQFELFVMWSEYDWAVLVPGGSCNLATKSAILSEMENMSSLGRVPKKASVYSWLALARVTLKDTPQGRDELLHVVPVVVKQLKDPSGCSRQGLFMHVPSTSLKSLPYIYWFYLVDMKYCMSHGCVKNSVKHTTICPL